ncbi:MAG: hypothetical protein V4557_14840 [Bacteroidota bacterium]
MKLFITVCLKEYHNDVYAIFKQAKIDVFSAAEVTGFKNNQIPQLLESWFASGEEKFDSAMLFSFTSSESAERGIELVKKYNTEMKTNFPLRAFIIPVEKTSI